MLGTQKGVAGTDCAFRCVKTTGAFPVRGELKWQDFCYNIEFVVIKVFFRAGKVSMRVNRGNLFPDDYAVMRTRPRRSDRRSRSWGCA